MFTAALYLDRHLELYACERARAQHVRGLRQHRGSHQGLRAIRGVQGWVRRHVAKTNLSENYANSLRTLGLNAIKSLFLPPPSYCSLAMINTTEIC